MRKGTEGYARTVASGTKERPLRISFVDSAGKALPRDPVPSGQAGRVGAVRGEAGREEPGAGRERQPLVLSEETESRIVPVARSRGSSGDSSEPFPGWMLIGEGVWAKRDYVIAGGPPFLLNKRAGTFQDEIVFETVAKYPSLEAAVMWAELKGEY